MKDDFYTGYYNVLEFGADPAADDNTRAFQSALDEAGKRGGTVYAPPGGYRFRGQLSVPPAVTLKGSFGTVPAHNGNRDEGLPKPGEFGTVLMPLADKSSENGPPFITLDTSSAFCGALVYYPEQTETGEPYPYPWCIAMRGKNPAVYDVELLNPYNAIDASQNERHMIRRVYGQPLRRGIFIDCIYDIGRVEDVHFNPWWSMKPDIYRFMVEKGEAFIIGRTDWEYMTNCFAIFYQVGYRFADFGGGPGNAVLTQCGHDIAPYTVVIEALQQHAGVSFVNCQFMGEFLVKDSNTGPVRLNGCGFWGVGPSEQGHKGMPSNLTLGGSGHVIVNGCHFTGWDNYPPEKGKMPAINVNCATAAITSCEFMEDKPVDIAVGENVKGCVITGNHFAGGAKIREDKPGVTQAGFNI